MIEHKLIKCESDSPDRCPSISGAAGQCPFAKIPGQKHCPRHAGGALAQQEHKAADMYRLAVWQKRLSEFCESDKTQSLRAEIGILRMTLESVVNKCDNATDLMLSSNKIGDLASRLEKLVTSADRLDRNMGTLMSKSAALAFASSIVNIIGEHIADPEVLDKISNKIIDALKELA